MKKLTCSLLSIIILLTISCEIGLGSSVDTDAPSLNIASEIVDTVKAKDFDIEGTYSDDGNIQNIRAVLHRTDDLGSDIKLDTYELIEDPKKRGSGTWKIPVKTEEIIDGSYQATVYITDGVGRVTTQSTTFTIDNTPPVLILTKPNSKPGDETVSTYGQRLFLAGNIADKANETYIEVEFYDNAEFLGEPLKVIKTSSIAPTDVNSNNAKLTVYKEEAYDAIYNPLTPLGKEGSKNIYIKITASDLAGNKTSDFYFSKDLAKKLTKSKQSNDPEAYGLVADDIYNILNGTDTLKNKERSADDRDAIKELLAENARQEAMFSLNPANSPYFTVSGMKTLTKSGKDFESADNGYFVIQGAQSLEVSVFMGSDSIELVDDEEFYVYLLECNEYGEPIDENGAVLNEEDDNSNYRIKLYSKSKETGSGVNKKTYYSKGGKEPKENTDGAYVFAIPMNKTIIYDPDVYDARDAQPQGVATQNIEIGKNYLIRVNGKDNEDNPVEPYETGYGFHLSSGGGAPVLNITKPEKNTIFQKKGEVVLFEGSTKSDEGVPEVTIWNGEKKLADVPLITNLDGELNEFSCPIPASKFNQNKSEIYSLTITATRGDAKTEKAYSIWYDVEGPKIDIKDNVIQPVVIANGKTNNINGMLKINGTIIDDFDQFGSATLTVIQNENPVNATITHLKIDENGETVDDKTVSGSSLSLESSFNFKLDTTKLIDKEAATLVIKATDRVGNESVWSKSFYVDQSTDRPLLINNSDSLDITQGRDESILNAGKNLFIRGGTLVLGVSDDDSVKNAIVTLAKKNSNDEFDESPVSDSNGILYKNYLSPSVISHPLPSDIGMYLVNIKVYDKNFISKQNTPDNYIECEFVLRVTGTGPDVTIKPKKEYISTLTGQGTNELEFEISNDGNGPYKLMLGDTEVDSGVSPLTYTITYPMDTTEADEIKFRIIDKNSSFTDKPFKAKFDNSCPEVSISSLPTKELTEETSYLFKGEMSDSPSGIKKVQIKFIDGNDPDSTTAEASDWLDCTAGASTWNYEATWGSNVLKDVFESEGNKTVIVKATDLAGNEKTTDPQVFVYDKMKPVITSITGASTSNGSDVTLTISINDTNPESVSLNIKQNGSIIPVTPVALAPVKTDATGTSWTSTVVIPFSTSITTDGSYEIEAFVTDENGKRSSGKSIEIIRDSAKPLVSNVKLINEADGKEAYYNNGKYYINNTKTTYKISGIAADTVGVTSVKLTVTKNGTTTKIEKNNANTSNSQWVFTGIDLKTWDVSGAKAKISVKDNAGNEADENVELDIVFDVTAPTAEHKIDDSNKNLEFRIGDYANDAGEPDVGGKYSDGTYGSALTMQIRGNFHDEAAGSGINKYYYKTFNNQEVTIDSDKENASVANGKIYFKNLNDLRDYVIANKTDTFLPLTAVESKNVEYNIIPGGSPATAQNTVGRFGGSPVNGYTVNDKGFVQFRTSVDSNFKTTIKGFKEGKNFLVLVAEDNVGNAAVDYATVSGVTYPCYSLNVDITAPKIVDRPAGTKTTSLIKELTSNEPNPDGKVEISGTVSDISKTNKEYGSSGLKSIVFTSDQSSDSVELEASAFTGTGTTEDPTLRNWTVDVRPLLSKEGMAIISAKVTDNAGFETSIPVANVVVDKSAPEITISDWPSDVALTEGAGYLFKGTAEEEAGASGVQKIEVKFSCGSGESLVESAWIEAEGKTNWKYNATWTADAIKNVFATEDEKTLTVRAIDVAGNVSTKTQTFVYDKQKPVLSVSGADVTKNDDVLLTITINDTNPTKPTVTYQKGESGTENSVIAGNLSGSGSNWTSTVTIPLKDKDDDSYLIKINETDKNGRVATLVTHSILKDNAPPVIVFTKPGESQGYEKNTSYTFEGTATDYNLKTLTAKLLKKNGDNFEEVTGQTATLSTDQSDKWTWKVYDLTDAVYKVTVTATDKTGNTKTESSSVLTVDRDAPVVTYTATNLKNANGVGVSTITNNGEYYAGTSSVVITATVTEPNYANDSANVTVSANNSVTTSEEYQGDKQFKVTPALNDGDTTITVTVQDLAENKTESKFVIHRDTTGPVIEIKNPQADSTNPLDDDSYTFRINATDTGVGVSKIYYKFTNSETRPTDWGTGEAFNGGDKYITRNFIAKGETSDVDSLNEGEWYLHVKAEDKSGNATIATPRHFVIDKAAPSIDYIKYGAISLTEKTNFYYDADTFTLTGKVTDTNGIKQVKVNNDVVYTAPANPTEQNPIKTSFDISKPITIVENQRNDITVEVQDITDAATRKTSKTYYVYKDTTAPVINLNSPAASVGTLTDNEYRFVGSVTDAGAGIESAKYLFTQTPFENDAAIKSSATTGTGWTAISDGNLDVTKTLGGNEAANLKEGKWYFYIYAKDNVSGNETNHVSVFTKEFWVDKTLPDITEISAGTSGAKVKKEESLTLSGTVTDENGIEKIEITEEAKKWTAASVPTGTGGNWTITIAPGTDNDKLTDGTHTLTITAFDKAGRTSSVQRTVVVDTVAPTHGALTIETPGKSFDEKTWYKTSFINIKLVGVADKDGSDTTNKASGIQKVEYSVNNGTSWKQMSGSNGSYTATADCSDADGNAVQGLNSIRVKITDNVGNETDAGTLTAYIDTEEPTLNTWRVKYLGDTYEPKSELLLNGQLPYYIQIDASDAKTSGINNNSGIDSVTYFYSSTSYNISGSLNEGKWEITVPVGSGTVNGINKYSSTGTNAIYAIVTDKAGNSVKERILTITYDNEPPSVEIREVTAAGSKTNLGTEENKDEVDDVNGKITISGSSSDGNKVDNVVLEYCEYEFKANAWTPKGDWQQITQKTTSTPNSWSAELDTTLLEDNTKYKIRATATDTAGNIGRTSKDAVGNTVTAEQYIYVNQDTDRPKITLNNFTIKDGDSHMSESNPVWFNRSELNGNVIDDDGAIESIKAIEKEITAEDPTTAEWDAAENKYKNGGWTYTFSGNATKKLYFQVKEKNGKTFTSNTASTTLATFGPKIVDSNDDITGADDIIYTTIDTTDPSLQNLYYYASANTTDVTTITGWKDTTNTDYLTEKFGGTKKYLYIKYKAYDSNGIYSITPTLAGNSTAITPTDITADAEKASYKECIAYFDISGIESGVKKQLTLNIKDNAAHRTNSDGINKYYQLDIDNDAPTASFTSYTSGSQVFGSSAVQLRGNTNDTNMVTKIEYALAKEIAVPSSGWTTITDTSKDSYTATTAWSISFDGKTTAVDKNNFHAPLLSTKVFDLYGNSVTTAMPIYVWLRVTDELGNIMPNGDTEASVYYLNVIPTGDIPSVEITYPANNASLGGEIRVTGTAETKDTSVSISDVYIQIDPSYDGSTFDEEWYRELDELIRGKQVPYSVVDAPVGVAQGKGIKIPDDVSKNSWYLTLNTLEEFNSKVGNENRRIGIRAYAISSTNKVTESVVYEYIVDPEAPQFGKTNALRFVQYDDEGNESASMRFDENVTLKGQWYLVGSVEDDSGINEMTLKIDSAEPLYLVQSTTSENTEDQNSSYDDYFEENTNITSDTENKNYDIKIPVGNSDANKFGLLQYEISVKDGSDKKTPNNLKFTVAYDNKAPDFEVKTASALTENGIIRQSNGSYTVTGTFREPSEGSKNQTGFGRIALYFTRTRNGKLSLLDPTSDDGANGDANFIDLTATGIVQKEGLYCRAANATLANDKELTVTDDNMPANIHAGGLCMVNNVFYRIKKIEDKKVTLDGTLNSFATAKEVYFALAQVIDNQTQEEGRTKVAAGTTGIDDIQYGDGDYMVEGVLLSNGIYNWNVSLDSSNMLDGPVNMTFVAFDKAGNNTLYSVAQKISNNAPRIAGVSFGADNDMDGTISDSEKVTTYRNWFTTSRLDTEYDGQNENGTWVTAFNPYEGNSRRFVIKGAAFVKPEIVGGNTGLGWKYTYNKNSTETTTDTTWYTAGHSNTGSVRTDNLTIDLSLLKLLKDEVDEGDQNFVFTILDKTEGGAAEATITLPVTVKLKDTSVPTTKIKPLTAGSVYQGSLSNGHIEVEKDLSSSSNFKTGGSTVYDLDAKISGKVTFEVTAEDNIIVNEIKAQITGYKTGNAFTIAKRNNSGVWTSDNLNASLVGTDAKDWSFVLETNGDTFDSDTGKNTVKFKFHFNTEALTDVAKANVEISFIAYDRGSPSLNEAGTEVVAANPSPSVPGTVSTGKNVDGSIATLADGSLDQEKETGYYKVDVVPYITKIDTDLNTAYSSVPSVFNRSARGYYPVKRGETITIHGFNLKKGETAPTVTITSTATVSESSKAKIKAAVPASAKSGELTVTVNGVPSLNNKTSKTVAYNQEPNGVNNNTLTDERKVWVWGSTEVVTDSSIRYPTFRVGSGGDEVFSYDVGGTDTYLYKNGTEYKVGSSFTQWYDTAVAVDGSGNLYGLALNGDCASPGSAENRYCASMYFYPMVLSSINVWAYTKGDTYTSYAEEGAFAWENTSDGNTYNPNRIQNPKLLVNDGKIYSVYYDATEKKVKFRAGTYSQSYAQYGNNHNFQYDSSDGTYKSDTGMDGKYVVRNGIYYRLKKLSNYDQWYTIEEYNGNATFNNAKVYTKTVTISDSISNYSNGSNGSAKNSQTIASGTAASAYSAVAIVSNAVAKVNDTTLTSTEDVAVVCWYDNTAKALKFSYNTTPLAGGTWSNAVTIDSDFAGWEPDMVVDGEGGIHISYYGASGADLKYAYLKNFKAETADVCTVDSYLSVGTKTSISVSSSKQTLTSDDGTSQSMYVPHISYYMSTFGSTQNCVKTAWPAVVVAKDEDPKKTYHYSNGVSTDRFTGNWEVQTLPLPETSFPKEYTIGIGEKDSSIILGYATDTGLETTTLYQ